MEKQITVKITYDWDSFDPNMDLSIADIEAAIKGYIFEYIIDKNKVKKLEIENDE
jgi:hypothetical protein